MGSGGVWWGLVGSGGFWWERGGPQKKLPTRTHQNLSEPIPPELIRTYPIRTHQNLSELIRTHQNLSEPIKEFKEISEIKESADRTEKTP